MKVTLISIGKTSESWLNEGMSVYINRLSHYTSFNYIEIDDAKVKSKKPDIQLLKNEEGVKILKQVGAGDHLLLFDERGKDYSSVEFARLFENHHHIGTKHLIFCIGGAYGFSDEVIQRSNGKISMSKMVFPHKLIRIFALEQIYRAHTILKGEPYHHN